MNGILCCVHVIDNHDNGERRGERNKERENSVDCSPLLLVIFSQNVSCGSHFCSREKERERERKEKKRERESRREFKSKVLFFFLPFLHFLFQVVVPLSALGNIPGWPRKCYCV